MTNLLWIIVGGLLMSAIATVGAVSALLRPATLERLLLPLVAVASGTLLGSAFFHMLPHGLAAMEVVRGAVWVVGGFALFLALEQFLHWHHSHGGEDGKTHPRAVLLLVGDGLHNFIGGLGVASVFLVDPRAGLTAWIAAAAHEIPQEIGDFGVLVHGGMSRLRALVWNFLSALTFPIGALLAYFLSRQIDVSALVLLGAGNFIYIAASDLVPEIKAHPSLRQALLHFACFAGGVLLTLALASHA